MNSVSKLCLFNCTSGIFCLCSETSEGRPLIQSHRKNSGEGRKNQIHHWKCHKDSHCARRHVSALHLSCHTTRKKCILVYWDLLSISFCHARLKQPQNKCTMSKHIYFELRLVFFFTFQHRRLIYSFKNVLIHNCFFLLASLFPLKLKMALCWMQEQLWIIA